MKILEIILEQINKSIKNNITLKELEDNFNDFFNPNDFIVELKKHKFKWWEEVTRVKKIGDKYFQYIWAITYKENIKDLCTFDINNIIEVEPYKEVITVTKYRSISNNKKGETT